MGLYLMMNEDAYINKIKAGWLLKVILTNLEFIILIQLLYLLQGWDLSEF